MNFVLDKSKRWGIIGTLLFHLLVFLVLLFIYLYPPFPPRPPIGLEVNLGVMDQGMGNIQPKKPIASTSTPTKAVTQKEIKKEKVVTQDIEKTISLESSKKKKKKKKKTKVAEKKIIKEKKVEKKKVAINNKFLLSKKIKASQGGSEGITKKPGDQGNVNGSLNSTNYIGFGGGNGKISYSLRGRKAKEIPKPVYMKSEIGTVVVKIWVDKNGNVTNARVLTKGTNTSSSMLQSLAVKSALKSHFDANVNAPDVQTGTITYSFIN